MNIKEALRNVISALGGTPTGKNVPSLINEVSENVSGGSGGGYDLEMKLVPTYVDGTRQTPTAENITVINGSSVDVARMILNGQIPKIKFAEIDGGGCMDFVCQYIDADPDYSCVMNFSCLLGVHGNAPNIIVTVGFAGDNEVEVLDYDYVTPTSSEVW